MTMLKIMFHTSTGSQVNGKRSTLVVKIATFAKSENESGHAKKTA